MKFSTKAVALVLAQGSIIVGLSFGAYILFFLIQKRWATK